jgi:hypothetical protein
MARRRRRAIGTTEDACSLCGAGPMTIVESCIVRRGVAWLAPRWDPHVHRYAVCPACGARHELADSPRHEVLTRVPEQGVASGATGGRACRLDPELPSA